MKECPKCGTIYTDKTLSFCLSDGEALSEDVREQKTEEFSGSLTDSAKASNRETEILRSDFRTDETVIRSIADKTNEQTTNRFWIFSTFALLVLFLISAFVGWHLISRPEDVGSTNINQTNSNISENTTRIGEGAVSETKDTYRVVGVKFNDVLYLRPAPGNLKSYVAKIPPDGAGIVLVGGRKKVGKSVWVRVRYDGKNGWVNQKFISRVADS